MRAAEAIVRVLEEAGVEVVFGIPGVHNLALFDALERSEVGVVVTRHEGAAAHAADGFARATGRAGVVLTTTGPGTANALAGVGEAWAAGSPVLLLTTQVASADAEAGIQRGILHQSPSQLEGFRPLTRFAERVRTSQSAPWTVAEALGRMFHGRRMPAYVEVPFDLLEGPSGPAELARPLPPATPDPAAIEEAARALATSASPAIWAGGGVVAADAQVALARIAERLDAPVVTTYLGRTALPASHPLAVAVAPQEPEVRQLLEGSDALLAVGTDFGATTTMGGRLRLPERVVRIDIDPAEFEKGPPSTAVEGDARAALEALDMALARLGVDRSGAGGAGSAGRVAQIRARIRRGIADDPRTAEAAAFLSAMEAALLPDVTVVCDMCVAGYWCGGYLPRYDARTLLYPLGWGTLGFGLPAAVGAASAVRGPVVAVVGDAGLMYYPGELATAHEHGLDLTVLCVNDGGYGMLRFDERKRYERTFAADLFTPDLAALAAAFDIPYQRAEIAGGSLERLLRASVAAGGVRLIEVRASLYPPRTTSPRWDEPS